MLNEAMVLELKWWMKKYYPPFVYSPMGSFSMKGVPVFIFHSVEPARFEEKLKFLSRNGYHTPSIGEFYEYISGKLALPPRSALLTFDDGDITLYDTAYPLLRKYGLRAVCFICPGLISGEKRENAGSPFAVWDEITEMEKSGAVDFQSHTLNHERIFTGDRIMDFLNPASFREKLGLSIPSVPGECGPEKLGSLGAPLYDTGSRMGERPRYVDEAALREKCVNYVLEKGGEKFFRRRGWRRELFEFSGRAGPGSGRFESEADRRGEIFRSLAESRRILEEKLGRGILHLAYPWGYGSKDSVELSRRAGCLTNFWGPLGACRIPKQGMDPYYVPRLKDDYIFRLPGKGRKPLAVIFRRKLSRRALKDDIY